MSKAGNERTVELQVGSEKLTLNGFVQDLFQEVIVAMLRSLGSTDERQEIQLRIGADTGAAESAD